MGAYLMLGGTPDSPTIRGDVTEPMHRGWIRINSWSNGAPRPIVSDGPQTPGDAGVSEITVTRDVDQASPMIFQHLMQGGTLDAARLDMTTSEGEDNVKVYYTINMTGVRITNYSVSGAGDDGSSSESFTLSSKSYIWKYLEKEPTD